MVSYSVCPVCRCLHDDGVVYPYRGKIFFICFFCYGYISYDDIDDILDSYFD